MLSAKEWIEHLQLEPHLEGGYFRRTFESPDRIGDRYACTAIYYLLTSAQPFTYFAKNRSDILHLFHAGAALTFRLLENGQYTERTLGPEEPQCLVPGGVWKSYGFEKGDYALITEVVTPGFEYADMQLASEADLKPHYPFDWAKLSSFVRG